MMAALATVADYVTAARILLQDQTAPYRYADADLVQGLSFAITEARRIRPDMFIGRFDELPFFSANNSTAVDIDPQYRVAFLYYMVGHVQLRDNEETQDQRASAFLSGFESKLKAL
jgi:hypothetical protein